VSLAQETSLIMMSASPNPIEDGPVQAYKQIVAKIQRAAKKAGRDPANIKLLAVSKEQDWSAIAPIVNHGHIDFAENRVKEAIQRWAEPKSYHNHIKVHLIGPLQSNKALEAVGFFESIQSLDRPSILEAVAKAIDSLGRAPRLMI